MARFVWETRAGDDPRGKSRVYFTCHPEDFAIYYPQIRKDFFGLQDCALCHRESFLEPLAPEDLMAGLDQMELMVVPVTKKLLTEPNRAMDQDIAFAKEQNIPILPILMEPGLDWLYAQPDRFGPRQYLEPGALDPTAVPYEEKLKRYLEMGLVGEEQARRIREAFRGYFFLSYRKKDRLYANELMKRIHRYPECADVAIWYDEFLTPGEDFESGIRQAMERSGLVILAVTPNLLEESEGKPNFVMGVEYPRARDAGKRILPVELVKTPRAALEAKYPGIGPCLDPEQEQFHRELLETLDVCGFSDRVDSAEQQYLMGMAYLHGIDVETDRKRGLELLESAVRQDHFGAMDALTYYSQACAERENNWALAILERHYGYCYQNYGERDPRSRTAYKMLCECYYFLVDCDEEAEGREFCYAIHKNVLGMKHPATVGAADELVSYYVWSCNEGGRVLKLSEWLYRFHLARDGAEHRDTLFALERWTQACLLEEHYGQALELALRYLEVKKKVYGSQSPHTQDAEEWVEEIMDLMKESEE